MEDLRSQAEYAAERAWVEAEMAVREEEDEWLAEYLFSGTAAYDASKSEKVAIARRLKAIWLAIVAGRL